MESIKKMSLSEKNMHCSIIEASEAASAFFIDNFGHSGHVGKNQDGAGNMYFYSSDAPLVADKYYYWVSNC